ncbi:gluconate 2-dehydrogenase subunit 3 family protein [Pedobacter sp. ISL-68]|uniref:gluconate 2-dehydrogenase subunit 3 family protein n=1 Tax=unclassified Pedobacter TaxID=2628915 RepID=UPI001BE5B2B5|nr:MULTISPECIES: gluconate 2-dehydrogenase subunit 3 family protein [unclassified Pedobacter]MBT2564554.1 gluconate 2-dehydrogenase subunit 3 family protein [Pedobacter sp. ISL-64]MBT2588766.1 gluconate 2-dehydrogenase subunit 3 family protein [Pedobacter sp. ISL-68]
MNRRDSIKALGLTAISTTVLLDACKQPETKTEVAPPEETAKEAGREQWEIDRDKNLKAETFFTKHEMATITVLADIIIPKDDVSGSASDAKVPEFIEFIVKDIPEHKVPMRGGLKWLDVYSFNKFQKSFVEASEDQQISIVDEIAYPKKARPEMQAGVTFFNRMRNLTASGFYTTEIGVKDIGYVGNAPNQWAGVPADVLKQYGMENVKV